jgi:formate hydrogenlyase subunit 3/multisubunit Na+/H+ antiporter MnhD subunit
MFSNNYLKKNKKLKARIHYIYLNLIIMHNITYSVLVLLGIICSVLADNVNGTNYEDISKKGGGTVRMLNNTGDTEAAAFAVIGSFVGLIVCCCMCIVGVCCYKNRHEKAKAKAKANINNNRHC